MNNKQEFMLVKQEQANKYNEYESRFVDLYKGLENMDSIELAQLYSLADWHINNIKKRAGNILKEKYKRSVNIQVNDSLYLERYYKEAERVIKYTEQYNNEQIMKYIIDKKIDWRNELPIDYEALKEKAWFKKALDNSEGYELVKFIPTTIEKKAVDKLTVKPLKKG